MAPWTPDRSLLRTTRGLVLATAAVLALGACGSGGGSDADAPTADDLDGTTYTSTGVSGHDLVEGTAVTLSFEGDRMAAAAGCNNQAAAYEVEGATLRWSGEAASTRMACPEDLTAQDQWLAGLLTDGMTVALDGSTLTLASGDVEMVLEAD
ncbi:MAG: META domain-containing protein [Nocardioides sp.]